MKVRDNRFRNGFALFLLLMLVASCSESQSNQVVQTVESEPAQIAKQTAPNFADRFVQALTVKDVDAMLEASGLPFVIRSQEWDFNAEADEHEMYVLAPATERAIEDLATLKEVFAELIREELAPTRNDYPSSKQQYLDVELAGADPRWATLRLSSYMLEEGDVEHIMLLGTRDGDNKVTALYSN